MLNREHNIPLTTARVPLPRGETRRVRLGPRALAVARQVAEGYTQAEIAAMAGCTVQTVKNLTSKLYRLTGVDDRVGLTLYVIHFVGFGDVETPPVKEGGRFDTQAA